MALSGVDVDVTAVPTPTSTTSGSLLITDSAPKSSEKDEAPALSSQLQDWQSQWSPDLSLPEYGGRYFGPNVIAGNPVCRWCFVVVWCSLEFEVL